jgi:hypothetical protein
MFFHVLFLFPETSQKPLEEVEEIFDDTTPGSFKYLGTPAWKTHVDTRTRRMERGQMDSEEKFDRQASQDEQYPAAPATTRVEEPKPEVTGKEVPATN